MNVLITGGFGFIGSNFINSIIDKNKYTNILNIDNLGYGSNKENLNEVKNNKKYQFKKADISKTMITSEIISKYDAVINFAAETHVDRSIVNPSQFIKSNIMGTYNLLESERKSNKPIRHIQISTDEVYGDILTGSFTEENKLKPSNPYSASKASAEMLSIAYQRTYGLDIVITRCTNNFGPFQFPEKLIPKTIIRAQKNLSIPIYGTGKNIRDWIYVLDHCSAIETILEKGKTGEIYNISSGNELGSIDIAHKILMILHKPDDLITFVDDRPGHDLRYSLDSNKLRALGWAPKYSFDEALEQTVKWYIQNEWWWKPLATDKILDPTPWKSK